MSARTLSDLLAAKDGLYQRAMVRQSMHPNDPATPDIVAVMQFVLTLAAHVVSETEANKQKAA
jgi:hypothetical protein